MASIQYLIFASAIALLMLAQEGENSLKLSSISYQKKNLQKVLFKCEIIHNKVLIRCDNVMSTWLSRLYDISRSND